MKTRSSISPSWVYRQNATFRWTSQPSLDAELIPVPCVMERRKWNYSDVEAVIFRSAIPPIRLNQLRVAGRAIPAPLSCSTALFWQPYTPTDDELIHRRSNTIVTLKQRLTVSLSICLGVCLSVCSSGCSVFAWFLAKLLLTIPGLSFDFTQRSWIKWCSRLGLE